MNLCGRLVLTTLGDLLGTLYRSQARGTLELIEDTGPAAGRLHRLHVDHGNLRLVESPLGAGRLGQLLVAQGLLSRSRHFELLASLEQSPGASTGQRLTELHWVDPTVIGQVVREQASHRLGALYHLRDARVAFRIARPNPLGFVTSLPLTVDEFLHGRPRTRDRQSAVREPVYPSMPSRIESCRVDPTRRQALLLLGLTPHADMADVKQAFRRMVSKLHPDRHLVAPEHQRELARRRFAQVTEAYQLLTG